MISIADIYESIFSGLEVKSIRKKTFPPEETDGEVVDIKKVDEKGKKQEEIIVKPEDDEPVIIRRKGS